MPKAQKAPQPKKKGARKPIRGAKPPRTAKQKAIAEAVKETIRFSKSNRGRQKKAPTVLFVDEKQMSFVPIYAGSEYDPKVLDYAYEYMHICYASYAKRERFTNNLTNDYKTGRLTGRKDDLEDSDRYVQIVRLPTIKDFIFWCVMEKGFMLTVDKVESWSVISPDFLAAMDLLRLASENFMHQLPTNNVGQTRMYEFLLKNNFGYRGDGDAGGGDSVPRIGIFNLIYQHLEQVKAAKPEEARTRDMDFQLLEAKALETNAKTPDGR